MGLKSYIRERLIAAVQYAVREELKNQNNIAGTETENVKYEEQIDRTEEIIARLDKQIERWTWERYKRIDEVVVPKIEKQIDLNAWNLKKNLDKSAENWTWERYKRIENTVVPKLDKVTEKWTWERYTRIKSDIQKVEEDIKKVDQNILEVLFEANKVKYINNENIKVVMLFQIPSCWPSVESVWNELIRDERYDATMLLYDREQREPKQMEGAREFLIEKGIEFIEAENYDFDKEKPHIFIYQTPWDDRHRPDFLKSDVIKKKGIRVVYLPYGIEYSASVRLSWIFSIMQFKARPWMSFVISDRIKLDHKLMSGYGADFLRVTGLPKFDGLYKKEDFNLESSIIEKINNREVIFWQMHFPALDGNENYPEPNIEVYLQFVKKLHHYDKQFFLVRPHPKFYEVYEQKGFDKEVEEFRNIIYNTENVFVYDAPDYRPALVNANYIIGDRSALMVESIVLDIPVLYMTNFYYKEKILDGIAPIFESYYQGSECYDMELFMDMIVNKKIDYKKCEREKAKELCIPFFDGKCGKRIVDEMASAILNEVE